MSRRGVLAAAGNLPVDAEPAGTLDMFSTSFVGGSFAEFNSCQWTGRNDSCLAYNGVDDYSATVVAVDGRPHVARFEVRDGDVPPFGGGERAEIAAPGPNGGADNALYEGDERWFAFDMKLDAAFPNPGGWGGVLWQTHPQSSTGSPPLVLDIDTSGNLGIANHDPSGYLRTDLGPAVKGVWRRYIIRAKFSPDELVGFREMWIDGVQVEPKTFCKTMLPGDTYNYLKLGHYRDNPSTGTAIVYFDNLRITGSGTGGSAGLAPAYRSHSVASVNQGSVAVSVAPPTTSPGGELPGPTDYQLVALEISSSSADVPITDPAGWVRRGNIIVQSPSTGASGTSRFVLYETTPEATLEQRQATFALTLTSARVWAAVRGCYAVPLGSTGRTVAVASKAEAEGTASTTHSLPTVNTTAVNSLVIAVGGSDQSNQIAATQSWPSTGLLTQRVSYTGPNTVEIQSVTMADQVVLTPTAGVGGTFTTQTLDECGFFVVVLNGT